MTVPHSLSCIFFLDDFKHGSLPPQKTVKWQLIGNLQKFFSNQDFIRPEHLLHISCFPNF